MSERRNFDLADPLRFTINRLKTFKYWPLSGSQIACRPEKLAEAGFIHRPDISADSTQCFVCQKVLAGWEKNEDPFEEHKSHSSDCLFVQLGPYENITCRQVIDLECQRFERIYRNHFDEAVRDNEGRLEQILGGLQSICTQNKDAPSSKGPTRRVTRARRRVP